MDSIKEKWQANSLKPLKVSLPTTGLIAESTVGECNSCEDYIQKSRVIDLRKQEALASQEEQESRRREGRVDADDLNSFESCCTQEATETTSDSNDHS